MADLTLGEFEQLVLLALTRQGETAYGVSICEDVADRTGRNISVGSVYKTLERLELKGLVTSAVGEPTAARGGRRKKHYLISPAGQRALRQSMRALKRMTDGLESALKL